MAADSEAVSSEQTKCSSNGIESQHGSEINPTELSGWLMKRGRLSRKWKKQWFQFKNGDLYYGKSQGSDLKKRIVLLESDLSDTDIDKKRFAFRIKSKENGRTHYMQAENEQSQKEWMQAICFIKSAGNNGSNSQACVIQ